MHEYVLYLGPVGLTTSGLANLNTIALNVAEAILRRGGSAYLSVRRFSADAGPPPDRPTPYLYVSSARGSLDAGCSTMNALLEIADQAGVTAGDVNPNLISMYARHPSAEIPTAIKVARPSPPPPRVRAARPAMAYAESGAGGIDTDAEQEDIVRRVQQLQRRSAAAATLRRRGAGRGEEQNEGGGRDEEQEGEFVMAGLGRRRRRVVRRRQPRAEKLFGNDPNFGHMYGSSYMLGEPSDTEGDVLRRAGFASSRQTPDDGDSAEPMFASGTENEETDDEMREVSVPREFDAEYDIGLTRNPKNPRNVVLSSIPQSQVVTRDKTRLESMIKDEARTRKEQTRRIREMYMNEKLRSGNQDLPAPINERRLITKRVDPQAAQKQAEEERGAWDLQQTRRIPKQYRDGSGAAFQDMVRSKGYQDRVKARKLNADDLAKLRRSEGKQRMRMNQQLWDASSDDDDDDGDDGEGDHAGARAVPQGMPRVRDQINASVYSRPQEMDELHERGFGLSDAESDFEYEAEEEEEEAGEDQQEDRVPVSFSAHDKRSRISNAIYSTFGDDDEGMTTDED